MSKEYQIIECPRDAMQGWPHFIPTAEKTAYINSLLQVGFHTIDFGSFVSPKAIPQMRDTADVLCGLNLATTSSKLLAIVANERGGAEAAQFDEITYLGFPFSISPTFQKRNTNSTIEESRHILEALQNLAAKAKKEVVVYLSMGFGNPFGDAYNEDILIGWADVLAGSGIRIISLADTVGLAAPEQITAALQNLIPKYPDVTVGVHLHAGTLNWRAKLQAAVEAGCTRIDGAIKGIGGCPMAGNTLVGNMNTENIIEHLKSEGVSLHLNNKALRNCVAIADQIFV